MATTVPAAGTDGRTAAADPRRTLTPPPALAAARAMARTDSSLGECPVCFDILPITDGILEAHVEGCISTAAAPAPATTARPAKPAGAATLTAPDTAAATSTSRTDTPTRTTTTATAAAAAAAREPAAKPAAAAPPENDVSSDETIARFLAAEGSFLVEEGPAAVHLRYSEDGEDEDEDEDEDVDVDEDEDEDVHDDGGAGADLVANPFACPICGDRFATEAAALTHVDTCLDDDAPTAAGGHAKDKDAAAAAGTKRRRTGNGGGNDDPDEDGTDVDDDADGQSPHKRHRHGTNGGGGSASSSSSKESCPLCDTSMSSEWMPAHFQRCFSDLKRKQILETDEDLAIKTARRFSAEGDAPVLEKCQLRALEVIEAKAKAASLAAEPALRARIKALRTGKNGRGPLAGYTDKDVDVLIEFIRRDAPMIIHFRAALLEQFAKDTHYRNRSEITPTFSRLHWETPMFSGAYKNAKAASLVKYGTLNPVKDPMGVRSAYGYGESYFILKRHVRYRATFSRCDSGSDQKTIATCEHYAHILAHYTDAELISVLDVASGRAKAVSTIGGLFGTYKEFQIHGPVEFARDVESVVLNPSVRTAVRGVADAAEAFCLRHGVGLLWMDQIEAAEI